MEENSERYETLIDIIEGPIHTIYETDRNKGYRMICLNSHSRKIIKDVSGSLEEWMG